MPLADALQDLNDEAANDVALHQGPAILGASRLGGGEGRNGGEPAIFEFTGMEIH